MRHAKVKGRIKAIIIFYNEGDTNIITICEPYHLNAQDLSHQGMQIKDPVHKEINQLWQNL